MTEHAKAELGRRLAALDPAARAALEASLRRRRAAPTGPEPLPRTEGDRAPLSFTQHRLWFLDQLDPGNPVYNVSWAMRCVGPLSVPALSAALDAVVARHDALRTVIELGDGEPWQRVLPRVDVPLRRSAVDGAADRQAAADAIAVAEARHRFDLATGPLVRAHLVRLDAGEHQLVLTVHHVVCDGWSLSVLLTDLAGAYEQALSGRTPALAPPAARYGDVAAWQRRRLTGAERERLLGYWRRALDGLPEQLDLPADRPRPAVSSFRGGRLPVELDAELTAGLRRLASEHGATLFMVLLAGFQTLLARYTGITDLAVGTPVSGRRHPDTEHLVGLFLDTVVLRGDLSGDPTFAELLDRTRSTALDAYGHAELPFEVLVDELADRRDLSRNPLFSVMLGLQNVPRRPAAAGALRFEPVIVDPGVSKFDLNLSLEEATNGVFGVLHYASDLMDADRMARLLGHYRTLLAAAVAAPHTRLSRLPLLDAAERALLAGWNDTARDHRLLPLPDAVAEQAARTPDAPALWADGAWTTYSGFIAGVNRLAHHLGRPGVVGVCLPRGAELVTAVHTVVTAGGAYLPLPPDQPDARLAAMVADAGATTVVTTAAHRGRFDGVRVVCLDTDRAAIAAGPATRPDVAVPLDALAYVIFTSGSTGRPKGVGVSHRAIANRLAWMQEAFGLDVDDRVLHKTPFSFDVSVWELFWPLLTGAGVVVAEDGAHRDSRRLAELVADTGVTTVHFVPSMLHAFLDEPGLAGLARPLRRVVCSGEALGPDLARRFAATLPAVELHNLYGPTEAAVDVSWHACVAGEDTVPIGRPVDNTRLHVLDAAGAPSPVGVPGELYIGGVQLAMGYLGRPGLTASRFVADPFEPGARLYRTGDLARWTSAGELEFLGRADHQVKINGHRVEPGEIEAALVDLPGVRSAVVLAHGHRLVGYPVTATDPDRDWAGLLRERLPEYLVPAVFVPLPELPLTANGKLDRAALPVPGAAVADRVACAPTGADELAVADAWRDVLDLAEVDAGDNFFAVGGDSIRSLRVVARLRTAGYQVRLPQLFLHQTVRDLAAAITGATGPSDGPSTDPSPPGATAARHPAGARGGVGGGGVADGPLGAAAVAAVAASGAADGYPLTALQQGMLFHSEFEAGSGTYHDVLTVTLDSTPATAPLRTALGDLTARHAVLRTSFDLTGFDEPVQLVHHRATVPLVEHDLSALDADTARARLLDWRTAETTAAFDWTRPPLLRVFLHRLPDGLGALTLSFHHAILDGWSVASLLTELLGRYHAHVTGTAAPPLTPPAASPRDLVAAERAAVTSGEAAAFWTATLADAPATRLPRLPRRPAPPTADARQASAAAGATEPAPAGTEQTSAVVDAGVARRLRELAVRLRVPLRTVLLAAHLRVLGLLSGDPDVVTGVVGHARPESEAGGEVLGLFLNTLPLRVDTRARTWSELVRRVFDAEVAVLAHREYPLFEVLRATGRAEPFDAVFDYRDFHVYAGLPGADGAPSIIARDFFEEINFGFCAAFTQVPPGAMAAAGELALLINHHTGEFDREQIVGIHHRYRAALAAMAADPDGDPRDPAPLLGADAAAVASWNDTAADLGPPTTLPDLVYARAARQPDAPAVIDRPAHAAGPADGDGGRVTTYGELTARADALAAELVAAGVGPDTLVAVHLPRSAELVVALLAVLRAGGAYLPLDTDYPVARLRLVLDDARPAAMLTGTEHAGRLPFTGPTVLIEAPHAGAPPPDGTVLPGQLACVLYTSGSTGRPKGVMLEHAALVNHVRWSIEAFGFTPADRLAQRAPIGFDLATGEIFSALVSGAALVVVPSEVVADGDALAELLARERVTYLLTVPSLLAIATEHGALGRCPDLRVVVSAGEALSRPLADATIAQTRARVVNGYGPSEAAVLASWWPADDAVPGGAVAGGAVSGGPVSGGPVSGGPVSGGATVPIGRGVSNTTMHVLDRDGRPLPVGTPGELFIGGAQLARGYHGRPGLTAERFVPDPSRPGARLYRTGDLVRWLPGGALEFLGRLDGQVKVRGVRIELGDVETALAGHPAVRHCVVVVREDLPGGPGLAGYVTGDGCDVAELRSHLRERLPEAMVPAALTVLDELPLLPNGKVHRAALPAPGAVARPYWPPRDPVEARMATIWEDLFGIDRVGIGDDFFDLGGHSLLALRLTVRLRQEFGTELPVSAVLTSPTVMGLADVLRGGSTARGGLVTMRADGDRPPLFVMHGLGGQVFRFLPLARRLGPDQPVYGITGRGLTGDERPHTDLDAMAADYAAQIRAVRPHGPYLLIGNCIGGNIAVEVARRLRAQGERVPLVMMLWSHATRPVVESTLNDDTMLMMQALAGGPLDVDLDKLRELDPEERLRAVVEAASAEDRLAPDTADLDQARAFLEIFRANAHAVGYHRPRPYDGTVVHLYPRDDPEYAPGYDYGWGELVSATLHCDTIPGTRDTTMYEPVVSRTAIELRSWIDRVLAEDQA
jgi:amino acid adenylation domain-containing protein